MATAPSTPSTLVEITNAANQGDATAQFKLGWYYEKGEGVVQDYTKAVEWYTKAANQGVTRAQFNLGVCYKDGKGVAQDHTKAVEWYTKAANQGNATAQFNLGVCYKNGKGVAQDYTKAVEWFAKAANQGYANAQFNLGLYYKNGKGVAQDYAKALEWFSKASIEGNVKAKKLAAELYVTIKEKNLVSEPVELSKDFIASSIKAICIGNSQYKHADWKDLPCSENDAINVGNQMHYFGAETQTFINKDKAALESAFKELKSKCVDENTFICIYYSGHGILSGQTKAIMAGGMDFEVEGWIRRLSRLPNTYVFGFLDCCRSEAVNKGPPGNSKTADGQLLLVHAVAPGAAAIAPQVTTGSDQKNSYATKSFLDYFSKRAEMVLPDDLNVWKATDKSFPTARVEWVINGFMKVTLSGKAKKPRKD